MGKPFGHPNNMEQLNTDGYEIFDNIYSDEEIQTLIGVIDAVDTESPTFRKSNDLFAIRQFFKEIPAAFELVFSVRLRNLLISSFGTDYFVVKSIYFDKPGESNWFVSYHQDLTISVDKRIVAKGFGPWTVKFNQYAVQPPVEILRDNFTVRVHLDTADEYNGALKVIPKSHFNGVFRLQDNATANSTEVICAVKKGGIMLMKPLLFHSSGRTQNNARRRVVHIEFSRCILPGGLQWSEREPYSACP
jgi:hypothetical protein